MEKDSGKNSAISTVKNLMGKPEKILNIEFEFKFIFS